METIRILKQRFSELASEIKKDREKLKEKENDLRLIKVALDAIRKENKKGNDIDS